MAAARSLPVSEPEKVQLWQPTAMHRTAFQAVVDGLAESLSCCSRSQVSSSATSGRLRSWHPRRRSCGVTPLIDGEQGIDALDRFDSDWRPLQPRQNLRRACAQQTASTLGPCRRLGS